MTLNDVAQPKLSVVINDKKYLTWPVGLAAEFDKCARTVQRWRDQQIGPPVIKIGRLQLVDPDDLPLWIETLKRQPLRSGRGEAA